MPICQQCESPFPNRAHIHGATRVLSKRKYCLTCSPFGEHNTRKLHEGQDEAGTCTKCSREFWYARSKGHRRTVCNSCNVKKSRHSLKDMAVAYKGGRCVLCAYDKCQGALEFHHKDPEHKDFRISDGVGRKWSAIIVEIDKCELVCANCHREIHAGLQNIPG